MTDEQNVDNTEDEMVDVEGHDARETPVLPQRPILFLDEAAEAHDGDL